MNFPPDFQSLTRFTDLSNLANVLANLIFVSLLVFSSAERTILLLLASINGRVGGGANIKWVEFIIRKLKKQRI